MTKKLTKNDSIALFERLLTKNEAWINYLKSWTEWNNLKTEKDIFTAWKEWTRKTPPEYWLSSAFYWRPLKGNPDFWERIDEEWIETIQNKKLGEDLKGVEDDNVLTTIYSRNRNK